ncbi:MAG: URC4/urg3 family protein [Bdellovibrionota bacterium]
MNDFARELIFTEQEIDYLLSPEAIRIQAKAIFDMCQDRKSYFVYHPENFLPAVAYVLQVIKKNYPDLNIPFHSRWGHFRVGGIDRVLELNKKLSGETEMEIARSKIDLVITSVLLDAGAGMKWKFLEKNETYSRSEGLGVASFHLFMSGAMSEDKTSPRVDANGLLSLRTQDLEEAFQVSAKNPLVGVEGRLKLLHNLALALENKKFFKDSRPGNLVDYLVETHGKEIPAKGILRAVLDALGSIWPGRLSASGVNLGDVWKHSTVSSVGGLKSLVPLHKLSQWMTYSLIEPIMEAGLTVVGVEELTGLAEYRNGGLMLDSGLLSFKNPEDALKDWLPGDDLVIEWRALTVYLLDQMAVEIRKTLNKSPKDFPLAKVLEGGTWWAGRYLAQEKREGATSPINLVSDGTVF